MMFADLFVLLTVAVVPTSATLSRSSAPPMGWNSYNSYNCVPTEKIVKSNAQSLVSLGLKQLGYNTVTTDCGWQTSARDSQQRMQWNTTLFPSGGKALGDYLHGLGLKFGVYSGAGYYQCGPTLLPASLGYEDIDAAAFAVWGADSLKYDNCYSTSRTTMVDSSSAEAQSSSRYLTMASSLDKSNRSMEFFICQWGIGEDLGVWASKLGNTWRISNDIYGAWRSIWRITNQVVPYYRQTRTGAFPDMDMLIVGLGSLSQEEERFHFGMWAINKSPLVIGAALDDRLSKASLTTLSNQEVIAINQDSLASQARLVRRYTEEEWDIWLGDLSGGRKVLGIANWRNNSRAVTFDLNTLNISSAAAKDIWAAKQVGIVSGTQNVNLAAHELKLWVLSNITVAAPPSSSGYFAAASAGLAGSASVTKCSSSSCLPTHTKIGNISTSAKVTFRSVVAKSAGTKLLGVDFINYDYASTTAWDWGSNTRNMSISVNGRSPKRWAFPLSGEDWYESGRLMVEADGFVEGDGNQVVFGAVGGNPAPDLVGFEIFE